MFVEDYTCSRVPLEKGRQPSTRASVPLDRSDRTPPTSAQVSAREVHYHIRPSSTPMCDKFYWDCGPKKKCYKRHKAVYKLDVIRDPVGFKLVVPDESIGRANRCGPVRKARLQRRQAPTTAAPEPLRYLLSPTTKQAIDAGLTAVS